MGKTLGKQVFEKEVGKGQRAEGVQTGQAQVWKGVAEV
jgi:hypothetical protein